MSVNETKTLEDEILVNESEAKDLVELEKEDKKSKMKAFGKNALKVAGVLGVGLLGFILGTKSNSNTEYYEEVADVNYETDNTEE